MQTRQSARTRQFLVGVAVSALLAPSGVFAHSLDAGMPLASQSQPASSANTTSGAPARDQTADDSGKSTANKVAAVIVTAPRYSPSTSSTGTKVDLPLLDVPQSIQAIPRQVLEDRQVVRINELTDKISGVQHTPGYGGISSMSSLFIRGFEQGAESYRNGFRDYGFLSPRDVSTIETFEVLKGPGSVLYGGGVYGVGGVVNTVTKKPLADPFHELNLTAGSYDFYRANLDTTGPVMGDGAVLYRLNASYEHDRGFRDFNKSETTFITPVVSWQIDAKTKLTLEVEYGHDRRVPDFGFPSDPLAYKIPITRFLGIPGVSRESTDSTSVTYTLEHQLNANWRFRQGFNVTSADEDLYGVYPDGGFDTDNRTLTVYPSKTFETSRNYTLQNEVFGTFQSGSFSHNLLVGLELARFNDNYYEADSSTVTIDVLNPDYHIAVSPPVPGYFSKTKDDNLGLYVQDFITVLPQVKLLAGGRYDLNRTSTNSGTIDSQSSGHFTPRLGLVYEPDTTTSLYAGWSSSFNPSFSGRSRTGQVFRPETAQQYEIGLKKRLLHDKLSLNLAVYQLTRQNVLTPDPADPNFSIQTGEKRSRGVEFDMAGELRPGWKLIATYAYTDATVTRDNDIPVGDRLRGVPRNGASLWTTYDIQTGSLSGLGFGAGLYYAGAREQNLPNYVVLPSFVRADAAISYRLPKATLRLNIKNLFDKKYYELGSDGPYPRAPRTVLLELSSRF